MAKLSALVKGDRQPSDRQHCIPTSLEMEPLINEMLLPLLPQTLRGLVEEEPEQLTSSSLVVAATILNIVVPTQSNHQLCLDLIPEGRQECWIASVCFKYKILQPGQRRIISVSGFHTHLRV